MTIQIRNHHSELDANYTLLLTSNSVERSAVNEILRNRCIADIGRDTRGCDIGFIGQRLALHVTGDSGISKPLSIGRIAQSLLANQQFPRPSLVLLVGFCWGNPKQATVGSVIVSPHLVLLNETRETQRGPERVTRHCQSPLQLTPTFIASLAEIVAPTGTRVIVGPIASLETLYQNENTRDQLVRQFPDLLGGEMEAFGFVTTSFPWLIVKAVSDLGGSEFNRERQRDAARSAAATVPHVLTLLSDEGYLPEHPANQPVTVLEDLITGIAMRVDVRELAANGLNDVLNDRIGRQLLYKLGRYVSAIEYDAEFPSVMCGVLLEIMQNAIKHGKANEAMVTLHPTKVLLWDDGKAFDPTTLSGRKGGAREWHTVRERYLDTGKVHFTAKRTTERVGNLYVFALPKASNVLRNARENCSMRIVPETIGAIYGRRQVFAFDPNCQVLYFRAEGIRMASRFIEIANAIRDVVLGGRKVYLGCPSEREAVLFKEELKDVAGEKLVVFVDAPSSH